jgi:hypothetical protein
MIVLMLVAGLGCLLAGLLAIGLGIPVKEFSFGNTLIVTGAVAACTGLIILGMSVVVRELRSIAGRLGGASNPSEWAAISARPKLGAIRSQAGESERFAASNDPDLAGSEAYPAPSAPWLEESTARDGIRDGTPSPAEPGETAPGPKPRRNLMFSSSSRRERERAKARDADPSAVDLPSAPAVAPTVAPAGESAPASFENAWPKSERPKASEAALQRRAGRAPTTFSEGNVGAAGAERKQPAGANEAQAPVTVLKSGVVDGMAYSLYSDGSIEAQMPEGMMRFASIDELRAHLDHRP